MRIPFVSSKEKFLLIELLPHTRRGLVLYVDSERGIHFEKYSEHLSPQELSRWLHWGRSRKKIIVTAHHSLAATITVPVKLEREADLVAHPISSTELENLLAQSMVKMFNQYREQVSKTLHTSELDTILVGNRVTHFKIDGHRIMNPVGFRGKSIATVFELTFTTREVFEEWKHFFSYGDRFFFTEMTRAQLSSLQRLHAVPLQLLVIEPEESWYFVLDKAAIGTLLHKGRIDWKSHHFVELFASAYGVSAHVGESLFHLYRKEQMSKGAREKFSRLVKTSEKMLAEALHATRLKGTVYITTPMPLPFSLPRKIGKVTLEDPPLHALMDALGFTITPHEWPFSPPQLFATLAPFLEFYYDKSDSTINHWLKRRLHWLAPEGTRAAVVSTG